MYEFDALMGDWTYKLEVTAIATQVKTLDLLVFSGKLKHKHLISISFLFFLNLIELFWLNNLFELLHRYK